MKSQLRERIESQETLPIKSNIKILDMDDEVKT